MNLSMNTSTRWSVLPAALALLLAAWPGVGRADEAVADEAPGRAERLAEPPLPDARPHLTIDMQRTLWVTSSLLVATGVSELYADRLAPKACRWCSPPQIDRWARNRLLWTDLKLASTISNAMMVAVPVGAALALVFSARADGAGGREVVEDVLVMTEAVSTATALMQVAKFTTGRLRPTAWASGGGISAGSRMSFWAGHSSSAFAFAAGATQVMRLRGRAGWGWVALATFTGAATISWMRIANDRHWFTDVIAGTAVGCTTGFLVPLLAFHPADGRKPPVMLVPAPGGLALIF
jgi:membrane-associated phospholipid phosphatase